MNVDVHVEAVRQLQTGYVAGLARARRSIHRACAGDVAGREFTLAYVDAARKRSSIAGDPVVRDLQVMTPSVDEDAAAALRAIRDSQSVDAGRVAPEAARERIGATTAAIPAAAILRTTSQQCRPGREASCQRRIPRARWEVHALS